MFKVFINNFLGKTPRWYKLTILSFLIINPIVFYCISPFVAGWMLLMQFIFTLALALKCYPVPSGGLLALQAIIIGLTSPEQVYKEVLVNLPVILLLIFMVAGIYYLKDLIFLAFAKLFVTVRTKRALALTICMTSAVMAAFLGALAVIVIIIAACFNFIAIYRRVALELEETEEGRAELDEFFGFWRNIVMHGAVGTILGGMLTIVGEPQNMMIATKVGWDFMDFLRHCFVVSVPVITAGFILCWLLETVKFPGFGYQLPERAYKAIVKNYEAKFTELSQQSVYTYMLQGIITILLFLALVFYVAEAGLIGIALIVVISAFTGRTHEHDFVEAFNNAMPFVLLITVFFAILAVVHDQHLVTPVVQMVFSFGGTAQLLALYFANGALSIVSDNVFIASVFITEVEQAYAQGAFSSEWFAKLAVVVNMGTNVPAVGTPNGHAALLLLLTSALSPIIKLAYFEMVKLALPYTIVMTVTGAAAIFFFI